MNEETKKMRPTPLSIRRRSTLIAEAALTTTEELESPLYEAFMELWRLNKKESLERSSLGWFIQGVRYGSLHQV